MHYRRWHRYGDVHFVKVDVSLSDEDRFWAKVEKTDDCWLWVGYKNKAGYGRIRYEGRLRVAHEVSWILAGNKVLPEKVLDHFKCYNPACVRPSHLEQVTPTQNKQNRKGARRDSGTGVRGVYPVTNSNTFQAGCTANGVTHYGGTFATVEEASAKAEELRSIYHKR